MAVDTETRGTDPADKKSGLKIHTLDCMGVSVAWDGQPPVYVPLHHDNVPDAERSANLDRLQSVFSTPDIVLVGHNVKFDLGVLSTLGIHFTGAAHDTSIMAWLDDENALHDL